MKTLVAVIVFIAVYIFLQVYLLPKMGFQT
jgi:hypothetical protein